MKKILFLIVAIIAIALFFRATIINNDKQLHKEYRINLFSESLAEEISLWLSRSNHDVSVEVLQKKRLGNSNKAIVLIKSTKGKYGIVTLKEGANKRYKIVLANYGSLRGNNIPRYTSVNTNKGMYYIIHGENKNKKADVVSLTALGPDNIEKSDYTTNLTIPKEDFYLLTKKIPEDPKWSFKNIQPAGFELNVKDDKGISIFSITSHIM